VRSLFIYFLTIFYSSIILIKNKGNEEKISHVRSLQRVPFAEMERWKFDEPRLGAAYGSYLNISDAMTFVHVTELEYNFVLNEISMVTC